MTANRTHLVRASGITVVWYEGHVISAWYDETGDPANLFEASCLTDPNPAADFLPENFFDVLAANTGGTDDIGFSRWLAANSEAIDCKHGIPRFLCALCPQSAADWPAQLPHGFQ